MLKITNDGRKLALDQRLVNELLPDDPGSKVSVCAEKSYEIWKDTVVQKSAQIIFCDLSTPKGDEKDEAQVSEVNTQNAIGAEHLGLQQVIYRYGDRAFSGGNHHWWQRGHRW